MNKTFSALSALTLSLSLYAQEQTPQEKYIETYAPVAVSEMQRTGIPASITLAQGIVESDSGQSELARMANNHFGIKCHSDWRGPSYVMDDDEIDECFRKYSMAEESFHDHSDFLRYRDRYSSLFMLSPFDYKSWAYGLKSAGYATDPAYARKLIRTIEEYRLYKYDNVDEETLPAAPAVIEEATALAAVNVETHHFSMSRAIYQKNGVAFVYAMQGETLESIADSNRLLLKELLLFNDLKSVRTLKDGEVVYLQLKKSRAEKGLEKYIVSADGETLREVSQRFAVRLSSLCKLNGFKDSGFALREGDTIKLRK